jgi:mRNA interferase MazF
MIGRPLHRGDVVLASFPFTHLSDKRVRPALVVSTISSGPDFILLFISSVIPHRPRPFDFILLPSHPEFPATGLRLPSVFRANRVGTFHRILLSKRLGRVGALIQREVDLRLKAAVGL